LSRQLRSRLLLAGILAVGLGLRLWGIGFAAGTPVGRPDEEIFSVEALAMFVRPYGRLATGWPDLAFTLWHAVLWVERAWYHLRYGQGVDVDVDVDVNLGCLLAVNPIALILPVRVVMAVLGAATAWIVGRLAAEIVPERAEAAALWATALYALNYLVGRDGHFAVSDALLCFEIALTLLFCARVATRRAWWLVAAGFCAGTAVSTKYSALGLAFPCATAAVELFLRERRRAAVPIACAAVAAVVGLLLWSPQIVTHWSEFRDGFAGQLGRYAANRSTPGSIFYPTVVFPTTFGWPGLLLCFAGLVWCARQRRGISLVVYAFMFYACFLGPLRLNYARYGSPLVPALTAGGGLAAALLIERLSGRIPRWLALVLVALLALALPTARLVAFDRLMARQDTRDLARDWLAARGADKIVLTEGSYAQVHAVDASVAAVCRRELPVALWRPVPILLAPIAPLTPAPGEFQSTVNPRYLPDRLSNAPAVAGQREAGWERIGFLGAQRFVIWEYDQQVALTDLHAPSAPDFLSRAEGPRAIGWVVGRTDRAKPVEKPADDRCWTPVASFSPGAQDAATWDTFDAFLVPFKDFGAMDRPGPQISIYRNACKAQ
jgi:4-amino-4-deoxy-L-arabinose transferase-like glycosyltransferase